MHQFLQYTVLGLVLGAVYAVAASGLVVTYTTSGIFNFAQGAIAMLAAFAYWQVRYAWGWPAPIALLAVLGVAAPVLGAGLYKVVMRGVRGTAEVTRLIVPISVMLGMLSLATWVWNPAPRTPRLTRKFFGPNATVSIAGVNVTWHELIAVGVAIAIAVALRLLLYRTRLGVAMRGVVDDADLIRLTGGRPDRLATTSWALGAFLAALAGVLITPIQGGAMSASALTLLVIDAFAAAMFGRLRSLPRTFLGAVFLGLAANYVIAYFPSDKWTWTGDFRVSLPMIVLFGVLLALPQERLRGAAVARSRERFRVPKVRSAVIAAAVLVAVVFLLRGIMAPPAVSSLAFGMTFGIIALSLVLLTGYGGQINLAPLSFGAIGTIVVFHFGTRGAGLGSRTTIWGYLLAALVCAVIGALVALPAVRLRGLHLALATMAFGVFVSRMVLTEIGPRQLPLLHTRFTIFPQGNLVVGRPQVGPVDFHGDGTFLMLVTFVFGGLGVALVALRNSGYGRRLAGLRDSPVGSATLGLSVVRLKLTAFMASAAIAGLGGALMSAQLRSVNLDRFDIFLSLTLVMLTVVCGIGYVSGGLFGGLLAAVAFSALEGTFLKIGADHATVHGLFHFLASSTLVLPALIGVSMGRNPTGVVDGIVTGWRRVQSAKPVLAAAVAAEAAIYLLRRSGVFSNWWFVAATAIIVGLALAAGAPLARAQTALAAEGDGVPLEFIGIDRPFSDTDRRLLEHDLGIEGVLPLPRAAAIRPGEVAAHGAA